MPKQVKDPIRKAFYQAKSENLKLYSSTNKKLGLKDAVKEHSGQEDQEKSDLTPNEHKRAFKRAYKSFVISGLQQKGDIDSYIERVIPHLKTLIECQLQEIQSTKIHLTICVIWKKLVKLAFNFNPEELEGAEDMAISNFDNYIRIDIPFNNKVTEFFLGSTIKELFTEMLAHIKTLRDDANFPESNFMLD